MYNTITLKFLGKGSGGIIDSVDNCTINISKCDSLAGSSYIKIPKELDHLKKRLINIQNTDDNECFKWCLIRYLHPSDHNPEELEKKVKIRKVDKNFARELDSKDIKLPVKIRDIHKIEKRESHRH